MIFCMLFGVVNFSTVVHASAKSKERGIYRTGEVYLFRGTGGIFSGGLSVIAKKFKRRGLRATVHTHQSWQRVSRDILKRAKSRGVSFPIILMGHSAGGRAALKLAKVLTNNGITVKYIVTFDPNTRQTVGRRINRVVNYYIPDKTNSNILLRGRGFGGGLSNINVSNYPGMNHLNVEKNNRLQKRVVATALSYTRRK